MLRLLPMSHRDKDIEILALRHQIAVLHRQLGDTRVRFSPADRPLLAALLHRLPRHILHRLRPPVRPDTILRWHPPPAPPTPRQDVATQTTRPTTHHPIHSSPGSAPAQRLARPEEVAAAAVWLCGPAAAFATGTTLTIDGGLVAGVPPFARPAKAN